MITHELLRELLKNDLQELQQIAKYVSNEIVYKALIVREFMKVRAIEDPREGIRGFHCFEREQLRRLGFVSTQIPRHELPRTA